jgi:hypothetical protein
MPEIKSSGLSYKTCLKCRVKDKDRDRKNCFHKRRLDKCTECNGCPHLRRKDACAECTPCPHLRLKSSCINCTPCPHLRLKRDCRECNDALKLTIQRFIKNSKNSDKLNNIFDIVNFIDKDFCKLLIEDSNNKCCYCKCELELINYGSKLMTIERINNSIGHIKSNVKIACFNCNVSKVGNLVN